MDLSQTVNLFASASAAAAGAVFVVTYQLRGRGRWRRSAMGRSLMSMGAALGLLGLYTVVITLWPDTAALLRWVRSLLVVAVAALLIQRTLMIQPPDDEPRPERKKRWWWPWR